LSGIFDDEILADELMRRLVDLLTVFIFLAAVVSNCVNAGEVTLGPAATALEDCDSNDGSEPVTAAESQLLVAHDRRGDTTEPILTQEIITPIDASTIFLAFLAPAGAVVQLKQPTVLRL
jgi:hypothetical protein